MSLLPDTGAVELTAFRQHIKQLLDRGERADGRAFDGLRTPHVVSEAASASPVTSGAAPSSATPMQGGLLASVVYTDDAATCVGCSVHGVFGPPRANRPDSGRLNVHVSAPFLQSDDLSGGGMNANTVTITSSLPELPLRQIEGYVQQVLESCVDLTQLSVLAGEACWVLTVSLTLLNTDGSVRASALHAAMAALHGLTLPRARLPDGSVTEARALKLAFVPTACSFAILGGQQVRLVTDSTAGEELVASGQLTVTVDEEGRIVDLQQLSQYPLLAAVLAAAVAQTVKASQMVRAAILA